VCLTRERQGFVGCDVSSTSGKGCKCVPEIRQVLGVYAGRYMIENVCNGRSMKEVWVCARDTGTEVVLMCAGSICMEHSG
jgi:hypothetical protein